jgi:hypothetical protein
MLRNNRKRFDTGAAAISNPVSLRIKKLLESEQLLHYIVPRPAHATGSSTSGT